MSLYSTKDAFSHYVFYLAVKRHFTSSYDYFKYNGKVTSSSHSFETRNDKFFFYRLSKEPDGKEIIFANILNNPNIWVGELVEDKAKEVHQEWKKKIDTLSYVFRTDLGELDFDDINKDILTKGEHPRLLKLYMMKRVNIETLIILDDLMGFFPYWNKNISDNIIWPDINMKCKKYQPFLSYEKTKMRKIVLDKYT